MATPLLVTLLLALPPAAVLRACVPLPMLASLHRSIQAMQVYLQGDRYF